MITTTSYWLFSLGEAGVHWRWGWGVIRSPFIRVWVWLGIFLCAISSDAFICTNLTNLGQEYGACVSKYQLV